VRGIKSRAATAEKRSKRDPESAPAKAAELAKAAKKAARRSSKKSEPALDSSWPITPTSPPPARPRKATALVDPTLSTAIDEAVAEALDPPEAKKAAKAPTTKKGATKKVSGPKKAAATKKAPATKKARAAKKAPADKTPVAKKAAAEAKAAPPQRTRAHLAAAAPVAKKASSSPPPAVNEPLAFINFVATYPVGSTLEGEVVSFTSHGAMVDVALPDGGRLHCYIPLSAMGTPPPTKARELLNKGEVRTFVLAGLDPPRRVAELSLPLAPAKKRRSPVKKAAKKAAKKSS
jgi:hypothetical protein